MKRSVVLMSMFVLMTFSVTLLAGQKFLLGGGHPGLQNLHGLIMKSVDGGKTWKEVWYQDKDGSTIFNIIHIKELKKIFAVGRIGILVSSDGGETWKQPNMPRGEYHGVVNFEVLDIAYGNGTLLAVSEGTTFLTSTDGGENWKSNMHDQNAKYINDKFKVWNDKVGPVGKRHYTGVLFVDGKFIVTGSYYDALVLQSKNGELEIVSETKNEDDATVKPANMLFDGKDRIFLFGQYRNWLSTDKGNTWKKLRNLKSTNFSGGGTYGKGTLVACGGHSTMMYSKDGKQWVKSKTDRDSPAPRDQFTCYSVRSGKDKFYAALREDKYLVSPDGATWTTQQAKHHPDNEEQYQINFYVIKPIEF